MTTIGTITASSRRLRSSNVFFFATVSGPKMTCLYSVSM